MLPEEVLKKAAEEMLDFHGSGMSINEMSHRSQTFQDVIDQAEQDLRRLMGIPDSYRILCHSDEPDEKEKSSLYYHRSVGKEGC